jgi:hypothetical protein
MDVRTFQDLIEEFVHQGLLKEDADEVDAEGGASLVSLLRKDVFGDPSTTERIGSHLTAGRLVMIPNALDRDFAESVYASLHECTKWKPREGFEPGFHFSHHNLVDSEDFPAPLRECHAIFGSHATRGFVERLSGRRCGGATTCAASWYQPGDHSLPHSDGNLQREVAFVWHLTKGWDSSWGGHLVWCPTGTLIKPMFNCLHLFVVNSTSYHFVSVVSGRCEHKRLAVNGWWNRPKEPREERQKAEPSPPEHDRSTSMVPSQLFGAERIRIGDVTIF